MKKIVLLIAAMLMIGSSIGFGQTTNKTPDKKCCGKKADILIADNHGTVNIHYYRNGPYHRPKKGKPAPAKAAPAPPTKACQYTDQQLALMKAKNDEQDFRLTLHDDALENHEQRLSAIEGHSPFALNSPEAKAYADSVTYATSVGSRIRIKYTGFGCVTCHHRTWFGHNKGWIIPIVGGVVVGAVVCEAMHPRDVYVFNTKIINNPGGGTTQVNTGTGGSTSTTGGPGPTPTIP